MVNVSFIIPSYNSYQTIGHTLKSIFDLKSFEYVRNVIVVDSSDDGKTRELLQKFNNTRLIIVSLDKKTSPALGRNMGAKLAQGDLLCFIDSDVFLDENWLEYVLKAHQSGCQVGCGSISAPDFQQKSKLALAQLYLQFNETLYVGEPRSVTLVPSCNMFCQKELFLRVRGFPMLRASEDTVFCLSLVKIVKIWFVPSAKVFHIFREDWNGFKRNQILLGQYISIYRRIFYKSWYYKGIFPVILFPAFLIIKSIRITTRIYKAGNDHFSKYLYSIFIYKLGIFYWSFGFIKGCFSNDENIRN